MRGYHGNREMTSHGITMTLIPILSRLNSIKLNTGVLILRLFIDKSKFYLGGNKM